MTMAARTMLVTPLLLLVACSSDVFHGAVFAEEDIHACNESVSLGASPSMALFPALPPSHVGPVDCWLEVKAPSHYLVSVLSVDSSEETKDTTCSNWVSFLDGGLGTPITDKVCSFKHVYRETTGDLMLIWYHAETTTSAERLRLKVQALRCPSTCEDRINLDRNNIVVEPVRRSGDDCSRDACFWKLCAPSETARVELHPKAYRQGQISKCDYSNVVIYDGELEGTKGQAGPMCENAYVSSAQCMFLEYRLGGFPAPRFQAFVTSISTSEIADGSTAWVMGTVIPVCAVLIFVFLVAFAWIQRVRQVRNMSTQTFRRARQRDQARGHGGTSTDRIASVSEGVADLPPSYSSVCLEQEGGPPPYPAEQYELHEPSPSLDESPLAATTVPSSSPLPLSHDSTPLEASPATSTPHPSPSHDRRT